MKLCKKQILLMALSVSLAFSQCAVIPVQGSEITAEMVMSVSTAEELEELSKKCTLDSWSVGKTVELTEDIDLTGKEFAAIPVFAGTFYGNGHTISGLNLNADTSSQGLFRYITADGLVENLIVSGTITSDDGQENLGGIVGSLEGTVRNCRFEGIVEGGSYVGGIAGRNKESGRIESCTFEGTLSGTTCTGGIAGENKGVISASENLGRINTAYDEESRLENVFLPKDTGGIAGLSTGTIINCENSAAVGHEHIGYNVGGIVGRSSGYLYGCKNEGIVKGRKDIGGICGQMVPDIRRVFSEDVLDKLDTELEVLRNLADNTSLHMTNNRTSVSNRLDMISDYARSATDNTADLAEMTVDWADANIEEINRLSDTIDDMMGRMERISANLEDVLDAMEDGIDEIEDIVEDGSEIYDLTSADIKEIQETISVLKQCKTQMKSDLEAIKESISSLLKAWTEWDTEACGAEAEAITTHAQSAIQAAILYKETLIELKSEIEDVPDLDRLLQSSSNSMENAATAFEDAAEEMEDVGDQVYRLFRSLSRRDPIEFETFGDEYQNKGEQIHSSVNSIGDQLTLLKNEINQTGDDISGDVERMENQLEVITNLLQDTAAEVREKDKDDYWQDVSEEDIKDTTIGKAESCYNFGTVEGDINVGGIAGVMDFEITSDPEDDMKEEGESSLNVHYETRVILESCINKGQVTSKKNYAGGVCGRMSLGYILECKNFADVASTDGDYTGGIAGQSSSTIRKCYSKGTMSGGDYVGGISGQAYNLYENTAFVSIGEASMYTGSVAGSVSDDGTMEENRFVENNEAGVDGISSQDKAEPVDYETLIMEEDTPTEFGTFIIKYVADDTVIGVVPAGYGYRVGDYPMPSIPKKSGYHAEWLVDDSDRITFDRVIEAKYIPYRTTLGSDVKRDPLYNVILVEGVFGESAEVLAEVMDAENGTEAWKISLQNIDAETSDSSPVKRTFRFIAPDEWKISKLTICTEENGEEELSWTEDGRACVFETDKTEFELLVTSEATSMIPVIGVGIAAVALILAVMIRLICRKHTKEC